MSELANRRPLKSRQTGWAGALARLLQKTPLTPNAVSVAGIGFAAVGAACFAFAPELPLLWLGGALFIQLRLLANLMDGLLAVEGGRKSPTGALYNEFPDRIEDALLLVAAGYGAGMPTLGWAAALLAMGTAYVRALGGSIGLTQDFCGPMAKQHRMALLTLGAVLSPFVAGMPVVLAAICFGAAVTSVRRLMRQARTLREAAR
ncbi:CDP-alcohol phosphatidyltransferase family protein [Novosphingobium sp. G106]|uniref:CDP-alcohol phosphatidyltransferase family protein n=1 Tax=Novosphingobium sp. G106 TaxID=2849500 RepID=UPI001C2CEEA0|nr:CDP-alcohol phosphatidyltransferase family protein [Novosphingobium sp. G106]MBV1689542.1 CDP-alcohol phosphatidyltransferase family protein [Novosphingobium sp. G106]